MLPPVTFDRVASEYERTRPIPPEIADLVARHISAHVESTDTMLDAGCGTGRFTRPLVRHHARTVGVDVSEPMLAELRQLCLQSGQDAPDTVVADLRQLPFTDGFFSGVLAVHVLHLIGDWRQALGEMWRVLAPGGYIFLGYEDRIPSVVREFYMHEGRRRGLLPEHAGAQNTRGDILPVLQNELGAIRMTETAPEAWRWTRTVSVRQMLADLSARLYSQQWAIPEEAHEAIQAATVANAIALLGPLEADPQEQQTVQFVLHAFQKPLRPASSRRPVPHRRA